MTIITEDGEYIIGVGGSVVLYSLFSTVKIRLNCEVDYALDFIKTGECKVSNIKKALEQMKIIQMELREITPREAVYNYENIEEEAPWNNNICEKISSCEELFTTDNGKVLIDELINILEYANKKNVSIILP